MRSFNILCKCFNAFGYNERIKYNLLRIKISIKKATWSQSKTMTEDTSLRIIINLFNYK